MPETTDRPLRWIDITMRVLGVGIAVVSAIAFLVMVALVLSLTVFGAQIG